MLCYNFSFELVESTQIKLKASETEFKNHKTKFATISENSNTAMPRADETKKGLSDLTKVVTALEINNRCPLYELRSSYLKRDIDHASVSKVLTDGSISSNSILLGSEPQVNDESISGSRAVLVVEKYYTFPRSDVALVVLEITPI